MDITFEGITLPSIPEDIIEKYQSFVVVEVKSNTSSSVLGYYLIAVDSSLSTLDSSSDEEPNTTYYLIAMSLGKWCSYRVLAGGSTWTVAKPEADLEPITGTISLVQSLGVVSNYTYRLVWSNVDIPYYPPTSEILLPVGDIGSESYGLLWDDFDTPNGAPDSAEIYIKATRPANLYFDMSDIEGRVSVTRPGTPPIKLYKFSDDIPTFDQLQTYSSTQRLLMDGADPMEFTYHASTDPVGINAPVMFASFGYICPYDNYTFTEDGISITIPEKGVYGAGLDAFEGIIELSGGNISVWYDDAVPVFADGFTSSDIHNIGMYVAGPYPLTTQLAERDILIITYDDTTYVKEVTHDDDADVGFCIVGDIAEDKSGPVFDNLPFFLGFMSGTDTGMLFVYTEEPGDHTLNILRYLPGEHNTGEPGEVPPTLAKRELSISLDVSHLHLNETAKLIITDNAADDSPVYSYGVNGKTVSIGNEDTVTGIGVGISTINITAPATSNFKEGQASLNIDVLRISREISCDYQNVDGVIYLGESRKPIITDNAAAESPTYTFSCTSGTDDVFVFDEDGTLHAVGEGVDTICMVAEQTPSYSSAVYYFTRTVQKFRHEREITATLDVIQEYGAKQIVLTDNAEAESPTYLFSSNDETIATVDSKGFVKALKVGTCYIGIYAEQTENYKHKALDIPVVVTEAELRAIAKGVLDGIADAIREVNGTTDVIKAKNFRQEILNLTGGGIRPNIYAYTPLIASVTFVELHSDTELADELLLENMSIIENNGRITGIERLDSLNFKLICTALEVGDSISIKALPGLYKNQNGISNEVIAVINNPALEDLLGYANNMTYKLNTTSPVDSGTYSIPITVDVWKDRATNVVVDADSIMTIGPFILKLNHRDSSLLQVSFRTYELINGLKVQKIRWYGYANWNTANTAYTWELYLFSNGDFMINLVNQPSSSFDGVTKFYGKSFTINAKQPQVSFYNNTLSGYEFEIVSELYDLSEALVVPSTFTLEELLNNRTYMLCHLWNSAKDDDVISIPISPWSYNGTKYETAYVSGNSFVGIGSNSEHIQINRRDNKIYYLFKQIGQVLLNNKSIAFTKIRWQGYSPYNSTTSTAAFIWDLYLFENGDAMLQLITKPSTWDGTFTFFGTTFTLSTNEEIVSFYRQNASGTSWTVMQGLYDITRSLNLVS